MPARRTVASSPPDATSAPGPEPAEVGDDGQRRVRLDRVGELDRGRQDGARARRPGARRRRGRRRTAASRSGSPGPPGRGRRGGPPAGSRSGPAVGRARRSRRRRRRRWRARGSSERLLEGDPRGRAGIAVLDEQRHRHGQAVLRRERAADGPGARHDDGAGRDDERRVGRARRGRARGRGRTAATSRSGSRRHR